MSFAQGAQEPKRTKLKLGRLVATPGSLRALDEANQVAFEFLQRHVSGDWGEVCSEDWQENELSLRKGFRVLSAYTLSTGKKIWIITEADRYATTILLPEEY